MNDIWIAAAGLAIAAALYIYLVYLPKRRQPDPVQRKWIIATLESIRGEADRKRLHPHAEPKIDVDAAFGQLRELMSDYPGPVCDSIDMLARRWQDLSRQYAEFQRQEATSALQSSIITTRTSKLADEIGELIDSIASELGAGK